MLWSHGLTKQKKIYSSWNYNIATIATTPPTAHPTAQQQSTVAHNSTPKRGNSCRTSLHRRVR